MTELSLTLLQPWEDKLTILVDMYSDLSKKEIDIDNEEGYAALKVAIKDCSSNRNKLKADGKTLRDDANKYAKSVIAREKELLKITEDLEGELKSKKDSIDEARTIRDRQILLPSRIEELKEIGITMKDDDLLLMSPEQYREFISLRKTEYLEAKEAKLNEQQELLNRELDKKKAIDKAIKEVNKIAKKENEIIKLKKKENINVIEQLVDEFIMSYIPQVNVDELKAGDIKINFINKLKNLING